MKQLDRTHILTRVIEAKVKRLQVSQMRVPEPIVKRMAETAKPVPSFQEALEAGASIIGVNNRDLKTFDVTLQTSLRLARLIPDDRLFVVESGIHTRKDIDLLLEAGADAFLIGEYFLTAPDPAVAIRGLL